MPEAKGRRETNPPRSRPRVKPASGYEDGELPPDEGPEETARTTQTAEQEAANGAGEELPGFDEEVNNRYEEIKRSGTHISELQQMTIPQLLKVAKDENISEYTGLKKQDLIFKILKERVKQ